MSIYQIPEVSELLKLIAAYELVHDYSARELIYANYVDIDKEAKTLYILKDEDPIYNVIHLEDIEHELDLLINLQCLTLDELFTKGLVSVFMTPEELEEFVVSGHYSVGEATKKLANEDLDLNYFLVKDTLYHTEEMSNSILFKDLI